MIVNENCPKCKKTVALVGDKETKKAYCPDCDTEIPRNTFIVNALVNAGKVRGKKTSVPSAYDLYCADCKSKEIPKLNGNKIFCAKCGGDFSKVNRVIYNLQIVRMKEKAKEKDE